jgi:hypothetical protein
MFPGAEAWTDVMFDRTCVQLGRLAVHHPPTYDATGPGPTP